MAGIPDVTVTRGLTNAVGRAGIGVSANGGVSWLLLDPQTYQVIGLGEKALSRESVMVKGSPITFSGTISMAWADVAIVTAPGQRERLQRAAPRPGPAPAPCGGYRCTASGAKTASP